MTATGETHKPDRPHSLGETFRLTSRMISAQRSIFWLAAIIFVVLLVWALILLLWWAWQFHVGEIRNSWTVSAIIDGVEFLVLFPYLEAAIVGGLIRAVADRVALREFWRDGFRYFGRAYLAFISSYILLFGFAFVGKLWWFFFYDVVGHGIGPVIGVIGDVTLFGLASFMLSLLVIGIFQLGWAGFGRTFRILRQRWSRMHALGLGMSLAWLVTMVILVLIFVALQSLLPPPPHTQFDGWNLLINFISPLIPVIAAIAVLGPLWISWFLIYYRRLNGMGLGPWAPADLQG